MKILQKRVQVLYRFRCKKCLSAFEMTETEKAESDKEFTGLEFKINVFDNFNCPVCNDVSTPHNREMQKIAVMDDGTEIMY